MSIVNIKDKAESRVTIHFPSITIKEDVPKVTLPPLKRLCIALGLRFEVGESSSAPTARPTRGFRADYGFVGTLDDEIRRDPKREVSYRITDTWDEMVKDMLGTPATTDVAGLSKWMTDFVTTIRQDTDEIYERLARTTRLMENEARLSCEAWVQLMDASDTTRAETQMAALQRRQGPARCPSHPKAPEEADFVILKMEEDNKVPLVLRRPFLHTNDAIIRVRQKQLNLRVGTERMTFAIDSGMKQSYSNDDTCSSINVIDEILEEDFDALLDEGSGILHSIEGTIHKRKTLC
nr:reverse transcriptase domain-containing protein [Tanacetum cinerariifolium]